MSGDINQMSESEELIRDLSPSMLWSVPNSTLIGAWQLLNFGMNQAFLPTGKIAPMHLHLGGYWEDKRALTYSRFLWFYGELNQKVEAVHTWNLVTGTVADKPASYYAYDFRHVERYAARYITAQSYVERYSTLNAAISAIRSLPWAVDQIWSVDEEDAVTEHIGESVLARSLFEAVRSTMEYASVQRFYSKTGSPPDGNSRTDFNAWADRRAKLNTWATNRNAALLAASSASQLWMAGNFFALAHQSREDEATFAYSVLGGISGVLGAGAAASGVVFGLLQARINERFTTEIIGGKYVYRSTSRVKVLSIARATYGALSIAQAATTLAMSIPLLADERLPEGERAMVAVNMSLQLAATTAQLSSLAATTIKTAAGIVKAGKILAPAVGSFATVVALGMNAVEIMSLVNRFEQAGILKNMGDPVSELLGDFAYRTAAVDTAIMSFNSGLMIAASAVAIAMLATGVGAPAAAAVELGAALVGAIVQWVVRPVMIDLLIEAMIVEIKAQGGPEAFFGRALTDRYMQMIQTPSFITSVNQLQLSYNVDYVVAVTTYSQGRNALEAAAMTGFLEEMGSTTQVGADIFVDGKLYEGEKYKDPVIDLVTGRLDVLSQAGEKLLITCITPLVVPGQQSFTPREIRVDKSKEHYTHALQVVTGGRWEITEAAGNSIVSLQNVVTTLRDKDGVVVHEVEVSLATGEGDDTVLAHASKLSVDGGAGIDTVSYDSLTGSNESFIRVSPTSSGFIVQKHMKNVMVYEEFQAPAEFTNPDGKTTTTVNYRDFRTGLYTGEVAQVDTLTNVENITGTAGNDIMHGNAGDNLLAGRAGNDELHGGDGGDVLSGGAGIDWVYGEGGDDKISQSTERHWETLNGGTGDDLVSYANAVFDDEATRNLVGITALLQENKVYTYGRLYGDVLAHIEHLEGSSLHDHIVGDDRNNYLLGGGGGDTLEGGKGNDTLDGGDGHETIWGGEGNDLIRERVSRSGNTLHGGTGIDTIDYSQSIIGSHQSFGIHTTIGVVDPYGRGFYFVENDDGPNPGRDYYSGIENFIGTSIADHISGDHGNNQFEGKGGNDELRGYGGDDTLIGDDGDDWLEGGAGNDVLAGGMGNDGVYGEAGDDVLVQELVGTEFLHGGAGLDTVDYSAAEVADPSRTVGIRVHLEEYREVNGQLINHTEVFKSVGDNSVYDVLSDVENVTGSRLDDTITGNSFHNVLQGAAGNDLIRGGEGIDQIKGDAGNDRLYGEEGADFLTAGPGADTLDGGAGDDFLFGGTLPTMRGRYVMIWRPEIPGADPSKDFVLDLKELLVYDKYGVNLASGKTFLHSSNVSMLGGVTNVPQLINGVIGDTVNPDSERVRTFKAGGTDTSVAPSGSWVGIDLGKEEEISWIRLYGSDDPALNRNLAIFVVNDERSLDWDYPTLRSSELDRYVTEDGSSIIDWTGATRSSKPEGDTLIGGEGSDMLNYWTESAAPRILEERGVSVDLELGRANQWYHPDRPASSVIDTLIGIEDVTATDLHDIVKGDANGNGLWGQAGNDVIEGRGGMDFLSGEDGDDVVDGGDDADMLLGGAGSDTVLGGGGDDHVVQDEARVTDVIDGGEGSDTLDYGQIEFVPGAGGATGSSTGIRAFLRSKLVEKHFGGTYTAIDVVRDQISGIENLIATSLDDHIVGTAGSNMLDGGAGADRIEGLEGDDMLIAGLGADTVSGGAGNDTVVAGDVAAVLRGRYLVIWRPATEEGGADLNPDYAITLKELEVRDRNGVNLAAAAGVTVTHSANISFTGTASALFDGKTDTALHAYSDAEARSALPNSWIMVDLGEVRDIAQVRLTGDTAQNSNLTLFVTHSPVSGSSDYAALLGDVPHFFSGDEAEKVLNWNASSHAGHGATYVSENNHYDGGEEPGDSDTLDYAARAVLPRVLMNRGVSVDLTAATANYWYHAHPNLANPAGQFVDTISGFEHVNGSVADDVLRGDAQANVLSGGNGNDILEGREGNDVLLAGAGKDTLHGGAGNDRLIASDVLSGETTLFGRYVVIWQLGTAGLNLTELEVHTLDEGNIAGKATLTHSSNLALGDTGSGLTDGTVTKGLVATNTLTTAPGSWVMLDLGKETNIAGIRLAGAAPLSQNLTMFVTNAPVATNARTAYDALMNDSKAPHYVVGADTGKEIWWTVAPHRSSNAKAVYDGGEETGDADTLDYSQSSHAERGIEGRGVSVDLMRASDQANHWYRADDTANAGLYADTVLGIENVVGSIANDILVGDAGDNALGGYLGDDVIAGGDGNDVLNGGPGADKLDGGNGNDKLVAGHISGRAALLGRYVMIWRPLPANGISYEEKSEYVLDLSEVKVIDAAGFDVAQGAGISHSDNLFGVKGLTNLIDGDTSSSLRTYSGTGDKTIANTWVMVDLGSITPISSIHLFGSGDAARNRNLSMFVLQEEPDLTLSEAELYASLRSDPLVAHYSTENDGRTLQAWSAASNLGAEADTYEGGTGSDTLDYSQSSEAMRIMEGRGVSVDLARIQPLAEFGTPIGYANHWYRADHPDDAQFHQDRITGIENVIGTMADDIIKGSADANTLMGSAGNDVIEGRDGNDMLIAGSGADTLRGGTGDDTLVASDMLTARSGLFGRYLVIWLADGAQLNLADVEVRDLAAVNLAREAIVSKSGNLEFATASSRLHDESVTEALIGTNAAPATPAWVMLDLKSHSSIFAIRLVGSDNATLNGKLTMFLMSEPMQAETLPSAAEYDALMANADVAHYVVGSDGAKEHVWTLAPHRGNTSGVYDGGTGNDTLDYAQSSVVERAMEGRGVSVDLADGEANHWYRRDETLDAAYYTDSLAGIEHVIGSVVDDVLQGDGAVNRLEGRAGNDLLDGRGGADTMVGGLGDDVYVVDHAGDVVIEQANEGNDTVVSSVDHVLAAEVENLTLVEGALGGRGNELDNVLIGNAQANTLDGAGGRDTVSYMTATSAVTVNMMTSVHSGVFAAGDVLINIEQLTGSAYNDRLTGNDGDNTLDGGAGADTLLGGIGNDVYLVDHVGDVVSEVAAPGTDTVVSTVDFVLGSNLENLTLAGMAVRGTGNNLANILIGNDGANILDGGAGADTMRGGKGDDTYVVNRSNDVIIEGDAAGDGIDTARVVEGAGYTLGANVENLELAGTVVSGTGNALNNVLTANAAANTLNGAGGLDTVSYAASTAAVTVNLGSTGLQSGGFAAGDKLVSIENVIGSDHNDRLTGDSGTNTFTGGGGADTITGDGVSDWADYTYSGSSSGIGVTIALTSSGPQKGADAEGDVLTGIVHVMASNNHDVITGNAKDNTLIGRWGDDTLEGKGGADYLWGAGHTDTASYASSYNGVTVDLESKNQVTQDSDAGGDMLRGIENVTGSAYADILRGANAASEVSDSADNVLRGEGGNDTLMGRAGSDTLYGGADNDLLDGGSGDDVMHGGTGNDTYQVDSGNDMIVEAANGGFDLVKASVSTVLSAHVENLTLLAGTAAITGVGNSANNVIYGNEHDNTLEGGAGADQLTGAGGNDTASYAGSAFGVTVNLSLLMQTAQSGDASNDTLRSIENVTGSAYADVLNGSSFVNEVSGSVDNVLRGEGGNDTLNGRSGNDTLYGGADNDLLDGGTGDDVTDGGTGDDIYQVDSSNDVIVEAADGGKDLVKASASYVLSDHIENLTLLVGTGAVSGTGNSRDNVIYGNEHDNTLEGGGGADQLMGGVGSDTASYAGSVVGVSVHLSLLTQSTQAGDASGDVLRSIENVTGSAYADVLIAAPSVNEVSGSVDNVLRGEGGNDTLQGRAGNDTLYGGADDDFLDGGTGVDAMDGGTGNDTYSVDSSADTIFEAQGGGTDLVRASTSFTLSQHVENLTLLVGTAARNGTGNGSDNVIYGNEHANLLEGLGGADQLDGGGGNDTLMGGTGNDTYFLRRGSGADVIIDHDTTAGNTDVLMLGADVNIGQLWFRRSGSDLEVSILGTEDKVTIANWYQGSAHHIEQIRTSYGPSLLNVDAWPGANKNVENLVQAMAQFDPPASNTHGTALWPVVTANWNFPA